MKQLKKFFYLLAVPFILFTGCRRSRSVSIPVVSGFDAGRFYGKWHEIARLPNWFERDMEKVTALYLPKQNGRISIVNQWIKKGRVRKITGEGYFADGSDRGELRITFQKPFYSKYRIIYIDDAYSTAIVCGDSKDYLWILARRPELERETLNKLLNFLRENDFAVDSLEFSGSSGKDNAK